MAETRAKRWSIADLDALPDDGRRTRYEIIDGELFVSRTPRAEHQIVCAEGTGALADWNTRTGLGFVLVGPGLVLSEHDASEPDFVWISRERYAQALDDKGHFRHPPELVVEVLSSGAVNVRRDREAKLRQYSRYGAEAYWIVDWQRALVDVYRRQGEQLRLVATLSVGDTLTSPLLPGFALPIARLFPWR